MGEARSTHGKADKCILGNPEGKRPLGRHRPRWEENIGIDPTKIGWEGVDWMHLAQNSDHGGPL
jgi:hypothetical protein